jgi:hypothetical protein
LVDLERLTKAIAKADLVIPDNIYYSTCASAINDSTLKLDNCKQNRGDRFLDKILHATRKSSHRYQRKIPLHGNSG